jgi:opacity protein-like surface antigen
MTHRATLPCLALLLVLGAAASATAQVATVQAGAQVKPSTVETTRDQTLVWSRNPSTIICSLPAGVQLEALSRDGKWYQVRVPEKFGGPGGAVGYAYASHLKLVDGPPPPETPYEPAPAGAAASGVPAPPPPPAPAIGVRGYGLGAYQWFLAKDSFNAILGTRGGFFYGGGGQVIIHHIFVDVSFERFKKTGERAIVVDGDVFRLGIPDTITMQPFTVVGGYRFRTKQGTTPYVGGGVGSLRFQEVSDFAEPGDNTDERFTSYHVVGGVEYAATRWLFLTTEFRFSSVPNAIGSPGIAGDFDEHNLGGFGLAVKVGVGR